MSYDTLFGLRERVAANLDRAVATVTIGEERFLWEISFPLQPQIQQAPNGQLAMAVTLGGWVILNCPSPILGDASITSGALFDLRRLADDEQTATEVVRQLATNLREAVAQKIALDNPPDLRMPPPDLRMPPLPPGWSRHG
jgi:hypothetical protein